MVLWVNWAVCVTELEFPLIEWLVEYLIYDVIFLSFFFTEYSERQPLCKFAVSPDGQFIAFQGLYGFIHLLSAKVSLYSKTFVIYTPVTIHFSIIIFLFIALYC